MATHEDAQTSALKAARQLLLGKYESLRMQVEDARERRQGLLLELQKSDREMKAIHQRMESLAEVLSMDAADEDEDVELPLEAKTAPLPIAIDRLLEEASFFADGHFSQELGEALSGGNPLLKLAPQLWSRAEWFEERRNSMPGKKTKSGN